MTHRLVPRSNVGAIAVAAIVTGLMLWSAAEVLGFDWIRAPFGYLWRQLGVLVGWE